MGDDQPGVGVLDDMLQQPAAIGEVDRHVDGAEIVEAEPDPDRVGSVGQPGQHVVALPRRPARASPIAVRRAIASVGDRSIPCRRRSGRTPCPASRARVRSSSGRSTHSSAGGMRGSCQVLVIGVPPLSLVSCSTHVVRTASVSLARVHDARRSRSGRRRHDLKRLDDALARRARRWWRHGGERVQQDLARVGRIDHVVVEKARRDLDRGVLALELVGQALVQVGALVGIGTPRAPARR